MTHRQSLFPVQVQNFVQVYCPVSRLSMLVAAGSPTATLVRHPLRLSSGLPVTGPRCLLLERNRKLGLA